MTYDTDEGREKKIHWHVHKIGLISRSYRALKEQNMEKIKAKTERA